MSGSNEKVLFQDQFDSGLDSSWVWLRENPGKWRLANGGLEIQIEPGVAETVRNALVRPAPDRSKGSFAIEVTVTSCTVPTQQYEQAGITWYRDDEAVVKEVKELIDGQIYVFPGKKPLADASVRLRLVVTADSWEAQYRRINEATFQTAAMGELPPPGEERVSIQCYNGPPDKVHWVRFEDFCIKQL